MLDLVLLSPFRCLLSLESSIQQDAKLSLFHQRRDVLSVVAARSLGRKAPRGSRGPFRSRNRSELGLGIGALPGEA